MTRALAATGLALAGLLTAGDAARADVSVSSLFGPHMVLQRDQKDRVWGKAAPGEDVTVSIAGQSHSAKAGADGRWTVTLDPLPAGGPHTLTIKGANTITVDDVLVGEVWLCSGQSNMEWDLANAIDGDLDALAAADDGIRLISVPKVGTQEPMDDFQGAWAASTPDAARGFSAVGYHFGRQLRRTLGVPIGLIDDAWGGSACEAWINRETLAADEKFKPLLDSWAEKEAEAASPEVQAKDREALDAYREASKAAKAEGKPGPRYPQTSRGQMTGNQRPANIYNGVLKPTIGYGMRGAIWYQGETNAGRAYQYRDLFPLMIRSWRDEWKIGDFPFYWVQLADYERERPEPAQSAWAELREAQTMTLARLPKTGQAVIIDIGEGQDIHPRNKRDVGLRLARWALAKDYGFDSLACQSPTYKSMHAEGSKVTITFDHADGGLKSFDVGAVRGFDLAGADRVFHRAEARVTGPETVEVHCDAVPEPVAARYAWADNPVCNLFSRVGLPATPFRTDDWPGVTANNVK